MSADRRDVEARAQEWDTSVFRNSSIDDALDGFPQEARDRYDAFLEEEVTQRDPRESRGMPASARALLRLLESRPGRRSDL